MTLTVKGQDGHTYRVTGKFAEPEHNQPFWNFDRGEVNFYQKPVGWTGKHPFGNRAVLLERVEAAYEVTVTLDEKQIEHLRGHLLNCACRDAADFTQQLVDAVFAGRYVEVAQETE